MNRKIICAALVCAVLLAGCSQFSEKRREREAIEKALKQYIDQQPGFEQAAADRAVRVFNVDRDRAEVVVEFKSRADGSIRLMIYHVRREGEAWKVVDAKTYAPRPT